MVNVMLDVLDGMSPAADVPEFKVRVFTSDFKFWFGVNGYW